MPQCEYIRCPWEGHLGLFLQEKGKIGCERSVIVSRHAKQKELLRCSRVDGYSLYPLLVEEGHSLVARPALPDPGGLIVRLLNAAITTECSLNSFKGLFAVAKWFSGRTRLY